MEINGMSTNLSSFLVKTFFERNLKDLQKYFIEKADERLLELHNQQVSFYELTENEEMIEKYKSLIKIRCRFEKYMNEDMFSVDVNDFIVGFRQLGVNIEDDKVQRIICAVRYS